MRPVSLALALLPLSAGSSWAQEAAPTLLEACPEFMKTRGMM
ncbi:MAG: hypothetical protein OEV92_07710 [Nitrospinota bacterium]|nr:hypothetical protein [Nitrospinota bacterium]